jgi:ribosome-associated translation inhibitor RaiA
MAIVRFHYSRTEKSKALESFLKERLEDVLAQYRVSVVGHIRVSFFVENGVVDPGTDQFRVKIFLRARRLGEIFLDVDASDPLATAHLAVDTLRLRLQKAKDRRRVQSWALKRAYAY